MTNPEANNTPRKDTEPEEGIDYIVDYYAVLGLDRSADSKEIKSSIKRVIKENHPDRLEGMDEKLARQGRAKTELATKARGILANEQHRSEYDEILEQWDGLVSTNGVAVDSPEQWAARKARAMSSEELEQEFDAGRQRIENAVGFSPKRTAVLKKLIDLSGDDIDDETREEYDAALLSQDRVYAIEQAQRAANLGMASDTMKAGFDHVEAIESGIEHGRTSSLETMKSLEASNIKGRLALMSGADITPPDGERLPVRQDIELPSWFDTQAEKVREIAKQREDILTERLLNLVVTYPEAELQSDTKDKFVMGIEFPDQVLWLGFLYDEANTNAEQAELDTDTQAKLQQGEYAAVINSGFNVGIVKPLEDIEIMTILEAALGKYVDTYHPSDEDGE